MQALKAVILLVLLAAAVVGGIVAFKLGKHLILVRLFLPPARAPAMLRRCRRAPRCTALCTARRRAAICCAALRCAALRCAALHSIRLTWRHAAALCSAGHDSEMRAFRLQFDASAEQLHADFQAKLNMKVRPCADSIRLAIVC
jgi:hypothetical protein